MKLPLANIMLKTEKIGNSVPKTNVTPPEVMFLVAQFHALAGGDPILKLEPVLQDGEQKFVELSAATERRRLAGKYGGTRVKRFFPGAMPQLPETFEEARQAGIGAELGESVMEKFMATTSNVEEVAA